MQCIFPKSSRLYLLIHRPYNLFRSDLKVQSAVLEQCMELNEKRMKVLYKLSIIEIPIVSPKLCYWHVTKFACGEGRQIKHHIQTFLFHLQNFL